MNNFVAVDSLLLQVRFPGEIHDVKEFVQPHQPHVQLQLEALRKENGGLQPWDCWDWVCRKIAYPLDRRGNANEYHRMDSYAYRSSFYCGLGWHIRPRIRQQVWEEWFDFPYEILSQRPMVADCDGASILLCSLLIGMGRHAHVAIGGFADDVDPLTHAWVVTDGQVWEVTTNEAGLAVEESEDYYIPLVYFNDREIQMDARAHELLDRMDYIPDLGTIFKPFGMVNNACRKIERITNLQGEVSYKCIKC